MFSVPRYIFSATRGHHPAKRTFQAIRIEVNSELSSIPPALDAAVRALRPEGPLYFLRHTQLCAAGTRIHFQFIVARRHGLFGDDAHHRLFKQKFAALASGCTCPREFPVCVCGKKPVVRIITKKPAYPPASER